MHWTAKLLHEIFGRIFSVIDFILKLIRWVLMGAFGLLSLIGVVIFIASQYDDEKAEAPAYNYVPPPEPRYADRRPPVRSPVAEEWDVLFERFMYESRPRLPSDERYLGRFNINGQPKPESTGSATLISTAGYLLTARHVVEGCRLLATLEENRVVRRVSNVSMATRGDVAIVRILGDGLPGEAVALRSSAEEVDELAYAYGFPMGELGSARLLWLGSGSIHHYYEEREEFNRPVYEAAVWAIDEFEPGRLTTMGGMSGGALLNRHGELIGVMFASSDNLRRGRMFSILPEMAGDLLATEHVPIRGATYHTEIDSDRFAEFAEKLQREGRIHQLYCKR